MSTPIDRPNPESSQGTHEVSDARAGPIVWAAFVLMIVVLVGLGAAWGLYRSLEKTVRRSEPPANPLSGDQTPPAPRLQPQPRAALERLRRAEEVRLNEYAWVDREKKTVHIPIDRAIDLLVERGFPIPSPTVQTPERKESTP